MGCDSQFDSLYEREPAAGVKAVSMREITILWRGTEHGHDDSEIDIDRSSCRFVGGTVVLDEGVDFLDLLPLRDGTLWVVEQEDGRIRNILRFVRVGE